MRHRACTHESKEIFRRSVFFAPNSGVRADIPGPPLWADFVEKVGCCGAEIQ
jgi:hypothetical protein